MRLLKTILLISVMTLYIGAQSFGRLVSPGQEEEETPMMPLNPLVESMALEEPVDPTSYILGPGDEIGLNILTSEVLTFPLTITPTGDLFIPAVGVCHVAGLTLSEGISTVQSFVQEHAFPGAQTYLALIKPRYFRVLVSGAVMEPGFVLMTPLTRLDEAIEQVGGFHQLAMEYDTKIIHKDGSRSIIDYHKYILDGDLEANPTLIEGDHIQIPFGEINRNGIVIRGSIAGAGYDIIAPGESLEKYIRRQVTFQNNADLQNITLSRAVDGVVNHIVILPGEFQETILHAQDEINFMWERGVMVTGFVQNPGGFSYFPGFSVSDYVALAGGNAPNGNPRAVVISHSIGTTEKGLDTKVIRGDVIYIPRTRKDIYIGDMSILGMLTAFVTIYLTFLSATK
ncbi:MAG: SLBB domain-containing protein [Candidatus Marinimicrobia bacterium]|nr:SLBB domain-containing protein [Candidatus Neomarinimicrobiota bacterium]